MGRTGWKGGMGNGRTLKVSGLVFCVVASLAAQSTSRRATSISTLVAYPSFFHLRPVVIVGKVTFSDSGGLRVGDDSGSLAILTKNTPVPEGTDEIRGEFWDIGRLTAEDPRLAGYDLKKSLHIDAETAWPKPGQAIAIAVTLAGPATTPVAPSVRNIALYPARYVDEHVTVTGQFAGRNLLGDLPESPGKSRYDFVIRTADAAMWVTNLRPRGKDFELALDSRIDTGRWVEVSGIVQQGHGLQWIEGMAGTIKLTQAPLEVATTDAPIRMSAGPAPEVIFSTPTADETDVALTTRIRIQFSRDIDPATIKGHVRATYLEAETRIRGEFDTPTANPTAQYSPANRVLELRFAEPLERFRTIKVELTEGILGTDHQPLKPWTLTFQTGA